MLFSKIKDRIIDVNLNRLSEGLRVIEEIVRFYLNDNQMVEQIRQIKRELWNNLSEVRKETIWSRRSEKDIGRSVAFDQTKRADFSGIFTANIKRSQEAARVLEELFKVTRPKFTGKKLATEPQRTQREILLIPSKKIYLFKNLRFTLYDLEKELLKRIAIQFVPRIYVILDIGTLGRTHLAEITKNCVLGGATMIQLREPKDAPINQWLDDASKIKSNIKNSKVKFIVNDRVDICQVVNADGVHLGNSDMPITYARNILGDGKIIGKTTRNLRQSLSAEKQGADYISVGAIFASPTKPSAPVVGTDELITVINGVKKPVVAIGGITPQKAKQLFKLGVSGIAITSSVFTEVNLKCKDFSKKIIENLKKFR